MRLAGIALFAVKGLGGVLVPSAAVEACGLAGDRRWMVVDPTGRFITQRTAPQMARVRATPTLATGGLHLSMAGLPPIDVASPSPGAPPLAVSVWRDSVAALLADSAAHAWISAALQLDCRLAHLHDTGARPCRSPAAQPGEVVSFADGFPVLLTSMDSLADLNARLAVPVPINRFRGNLLVEGAGAWAEDAWRVIRIGGAVFRVAKPCDRCIVTTIDQATGERPQKSEPLRTLGQFRHDERGIMFGQNLVALQLGRVAVGDAIEVLEAGPPNVRPL